MHNRPSDRTAGPEERDDGADADADSTADADVSPVTRRQYEALFDHPKMAAVVLEPDGRVRRLNESAREMLPDVAEGVVGRPLPETAFAERLSITPERLRAHLEDARERETVTYETRYRYGALSRDLDVTVDPVTRRDGSIERILLTAYDVTQRVEQERELQARNEQLREFETLVGTSPDGIFKLDADGRMQYVNDAWAETVDRDPAKLEGKPFAELVEEGAVPQQVVEDYVELLPELLSDGTDAERGKLEITVTPPGDDEKHVYEARVSVLPYDETFDGCAVVVRDVTESRRRERQLDELRDRLTYVLEGTNSLLWSLDLETGEMEEIQGPVEQLHRVERGALSDVSAVIESVHPEDREEVTEAYETVTSGESDRASVTYRTHPDNGETNWIRTSASVQRGADAPDGSPRLLGLSTDFSTAHERQAELRRQNDRLEEFASVVSHDLRSPLAIVDARLEMAREDADSEHFEHIQGAIDRMDDLINDLLALARKGQTITETEPVDVAGTAEQCWPRIETADATLRTGTERRIAADASRLAQLLENLFRNAVEHGGNEVAITVGELDGESGFFVEDDGPGIPEKRREEALEAGYSTAEDGTGFGLSIVREVAEAHGWEMRLAEGDAGGARIEIAGVEYAE